MKDFTKIFAAIVPLLCVAAGAATPPSQTPRPFVFGINAGDEIPDLTLAKAAGCTCVRIGCGWDLVEPVDGRIDWKDSDRAVALCREFGFEPFFLIVATPKWALSPKKRNKPWGWPAEPAFYSQARRFYKALAERYRGKVKYYEFWNEENGYGWNEVGRPDQYAPILKLAYQALKDGDPDCVVAIGGLDGAGWKGYYRYLEDLYKLGCGDSFDAVAVHPYRQDGPIDVYGLRKIHEVLVKHGQGHKKLWLTEYGWSKEYGHANKAKWLKQSLDILTSPEMDFVFQASVHTLGDFNDAEYGMCDGKLRPRWAYQVFRDYPKDWKTIEEMHKASLPPNQCKFPGDGFEIGKLRWTPYGDGMQIRKTGELGITAEFGERFLAADGAESLKNGGAWLGVETAPGVPVQLEARVYSNQHCDDSRNSRCRVGIDPAGGTDPTARTVIWSRWLDTSGAWDTAGIGQIEPIVPKCGKIIAFLEYKQTGGACRQVSVFDEVKIIAREETFKLPKVEPVVTPTKVYEPAVAAK